MLGKETKVERWIVQPSTDMVVAAVNHWKYQKKLDYPNVKDNNIKINYPHTPQTHDWSTNSIESLPSKKQKRATMWVLVKKSVKSVNGSGMLFDFKIGSWNWGTIVYPYIPVPKTKFFTTLEVIRVYRQSREWWLHAFYRKTWWKGREKIILFRWRWKK